MKSQKKKIIALILCISTLLCLCMGKISYATEDETDGNNTTETSTDNSNNNNNSNSNNNSNNSESISSGNTADSSNQESSNNNSESNKTQTNGNSSASTTSSSTTSSNTTSTTKSSNANLSNLGITPHDFKGFVPGTTSYEVSVPEDTEEVEVYAQTQNAKATLTGTGKKKLEKGENKVEIVVTAEDGTQKTYTINISREVIQEGTEETSNAENSEGLSELKINNLSLQPEFKTDIYEYTVKYIGEDTKLNIEAKGTNENYIIEIIGNEDIQEGENTITILVSDKEGENIATYQIIVNKSLVDEEAIAEQEAQKKAMQQKIIIGAILAIIVIVAIIIFVIRKHRRNAQYEEDAYDDYYDDEYEELEEEELEEKRAKLKAKFLNNYSSDEEHKEINQGSQPKKTSGKRFK